ncbi:MAG TPA: hypothetical protein QGF05_08090 [Dehalococcoidia bacterium]|nr:hypothetical protein [Dehalococcoidia bacterium]
MLPRLYNSETVADAIMDDFESAPIPDIHKTMFRWVEKFTRRAWDMTAADIQSLRDQGVGDTDIVDWAQVAALQTWWVMQADGGGIPLEGNAIAGQAVGNERDWYHAAEAGLTAAPPSLPVAVRGAAGNEIAWVETDESNETFQEYAGKAQDRWGTVPNLYKATSLKFDILPRHHLALELLESPKSSLTPKQHAMARALTSALNHAPYTSTTTREQLKCAGGDDALFDQVTSDYTQHDWDPQDKVVLDFTAKMTCNAYKVWEADAEGFREAGLNDEAYVEIVELVSIQSSIDRLANSLGIAPDAQPLLTN